MLIFEHFPSFKPGFQFGITGSHYIVRLVFLAESFVVLLLLRVHLSMIYDLIRLQKPSVLFLLLIIVELFLYHIDPLLRQVLTVVIIIIWKVD